MAKKETTAVVKWDEELAKQAEIAAGMEASAGGGQFFSTKGGILAWQDAPMPNNQMAVVILDSILENVYYEGKYDPTVQQAPKCFAFGRDEKEMKPHKIVVDAGTEQSSECTGCPMNEWGSADVGKGKACRNTRRLAMVPGGSFTAQGKFELIDNPEHYASTAVGYMKLPVTSVKGYANFVKQVAGALHRPPFGIFTKVRVVPDQATQFKVLFEPITTVPDSLMSVVMERRSEVGSLIDFPYTPFEEQEAPKSKAAKPIKAKGRKY